MTMWLRTFLLMVLVVLPGFAMADLSDSPLVPKEEAAFARDYLQKLRGRSFDHVKQHLDPELAAQVTDQKLEDIAAYFPTGKVVSTVLIGSQTNTHNAKWQGNFSFEYQFEGGWALANVVLKRTGDKLAVVGFNVYRTEKSQREINAFSFQGKSFWHYAILVLAAGVPLFILATLIVCLRTPIPRKKWLWVLFVLVGVGNISLNWTTGAMDFKVLQLLLFGSGVVRPSEYAPWVITVGLPIGAGVFWFKRRKLITASLADGSAQSTTPSANASASE